MGSGGPLWAENPPKASELRPGELQPLQPRHLPGARVDALRRAKPRDDARAAPHRATEQEKAARDHAGPAPQPLHSAANAWKCAAFQESEGFRHFVRRERAVQQHDGRDVYRRDDDEWENRAEAPHPAHVLHGSVVSRLDGVVIDVPKELHVLKVAEMRHARERVATEAVVVHLVFPLRRLVGHFASEKIKRLAAPQRQPPPPAPDSPLPCLGSLAARHRRLKPHPRTIPTARRIVIPCTGKRRGITAGWRK